jgi:hypothetical protein
MQEKDHGQTTDDRGQKIARNWNYELGTAGRRGDPPASPEGEADGGQARRNGDTARTTEGRGQKFYCGSGFLAAIFRF